MKRTDACLDCPISLICMSGAMDVGEIYVCGVCGGADFVANKWELQKIWLKGTGEGAAQAAMHIREDCPRILRKDGTVVGLERGRDEEGEIRVVRPTVYACVECFKQKFSRSKQDLNFDAVFYYVNGRHRT